MSYQERVKRVGDYVYQHCHHPTVLLLHLLPSFPSFFQPLLGPLPPLPLSSHFKLSHVGGCQTGAPQCGGSLIRTDRHQKRSTACVSILGRHNLIFIFIFFMPRSFPKTLKHLFLPCSRWLSSPVIIVCLLLFLQ